GKVVQYMGNGLLATDARGRIVSTNTASEKIIGMQAAEMEGRLVYEVMALPPLRDFFEQGCNASLPLKIEGDCPGGGGSVIRVGMKISRLGGPDLGAEGFICVFDDLTEIRHMEEKVRQTEQLAIVGRFSAGLAHEIRNPLASLSGSIQVLRKGLNLEGDNQQLMEIVIKETQRLNHIVTDFLNFAQPKRKKSCLIDMTQLIQDVLLLLKNSNEFHASIDMELKAPHDHILIESDEEQIRQMVWNLCINGVQAMDGEGRLTLTLARTSGFRHGEFSTSRKGILLMVEDQGRGIPQDQIQQIFNPFYTTRDEGVGLGLATVKKIVERFGGYIGVTSQDADGRPDAKTGTCFEVFLPQERALVGQRKPVREMRETHAEI
ncbi:MAG: nitrogen regulation protein NR(II), partial [Nitrospinaceae bacterium]